jgi:hypothetical protein
MELEFNILSEVIQAQKAKKSYVLPYTRIVVLKQMQ